MVKVLFLILNYKTYQDTIKVVNELLVSKRKDYKILIVDNASPNDSYSKINNVFEGSDIVEVISSSENGGYAKGNNFGLRYAERLNPEYVCIINNDVHFSWDTIEALIDIYPKLNNPALIAPLQKLPDGKILEFPSLEVPNLLYDIRMNSLFFKPKTHIYEANTEFNNVQKVGFIPGAFLFVKYDVFNNIGFFDESTFLFCEERFTGKIVADAGLNNYLILDLEYLHEHSKTISTEASEKKQRELIHEGRLRYHKRYSKWSMISKVLLTISFYFHEFEIYLLNLRK